MGNGFQCNHVVAEVDDEIDLRCLCCGFEKLFFGRSIDFWDLFASPITVGFPHGKWPQTGSEGFGISERLIFLTKSMSFVPFSELYFPFLVRHSTRFNRLPVGFTAKRDRYVTCTHADGKRV